VRPQQGPPRELARQSFDNACQSLSIAYTIGRVENWTDVATALRQIARGFNALADAIAGETTPEELRALALLREWGGQGLTRSEASALFRKHGFAPQTAGGWTRADWIETRDDGRRYLTSESHRWLAEREASDDG
jgi:hypothetical protein